MLETVGKRVVYFDNAKFLLIILVVFGHIISPYSNDHHFLNTLYKTIYTFHMPAFILVAGYFAKGFRKKGYMKKLTVKLLIPYIIFQIVFTIFFSIKGENPTLSLFDPQWTLWFLLSLFSWHLLLFVFEKMKYAFVVSILVGVIIGTLPFIGTYLSLSRTLVFFPFFLLGFLLQKKHFEKLVEAKWRMAGGIFLVSLFFSYYFFFYDISKKWLFASYSYTEIVPVEEIGLFVRLILYGVMFLAAFSFLALMPKKNYPFTRLGERTLYVYLLHGVVIKLIDITPLHGEIVQTDWPFILFVEAILLTILLSSKQVLQLTRPIVEPKIRL